MLKKPSRYNVFDAAKCSSSGYCYRVTSPGDCEDAFAADAEVAVSGSDPAKSTKDVATNGSSVRATASSMESTESMEVDDETRYANNDRKLCFSLTHYRVFSPNRLLPARTDDTVPSQVEDGRGGFTFCAVKPA